jgi:hypothetical protein
VKVSVTLTKVKNQIKTAPTVAFISPKDLKVTVEVVYYLPRVQLQLVHGVRLGRRQTLKWQNSFCLSK